MTKELTPEAKKQFDEHMNALIQIVTGTSDDILDSKETMWSFKAKWGKDALLLPLSAFQAACVCPEEEWVDRFKDDPMLIHLWYAANHKKLPNSPMRS